MKSVGGFDYNVNANWHTVVIHRSIGMDTTGDIVLSDWLDKYCPGDDEDYNGWLFHKDKSRCVFFFREKEVAILFALSWS